MNAQKHTNTKQNMNLTHKTHELNMFELQSNALLFELASDTKPTKLTRTDKLWTPNFSLSDEGNTEKKELPECSRCFPPYVLYYNIL